MSWPTVVVVVVEKKDGVGTMEAGMCWLLIGCREQVFIGVLPISILVVGLIGRQWSIRASGLSTGKASPNQPSCLCINDLYISRAVR